MLEKLVILINYLKNNKAIIIYIVESTKILLQFCIYKIKIDDFVFYKLLYINLL